MRKLILLSLLLSSIFCFPQKFDKAYIGDVEITKAYIGNVLVVDNSPAIDSDAQAFITAVGTLNDTQKTAINNLVKGLKLNGTWAKYKALYPVIGGTASAHKWNLKDPRDLDAAFRLTFNGTWTHNEFGAKGDGATGTYANTHLVDSDVFEILSNKINMSVGYYSNIEVSDSDKTEMSNNGWHGKGLFLQVNYGSGSWGGLYNGENDMPNTLSDLVYVQLSAIDGVVKQFINGVPAQTLNTQNASFQDKPIVINAAYNNDSNDFDDSWFSEKRFALAYISDGLTDSEIAADYIVIQAYQTALGRDI